MPQAAIQFALIAIVVPTAFVSFGLVAVRDAW